MKTVQMLKRGREDFRPDDESILIREIDSLEGLRSGRADWNRAVEGSSFDSVFATHEWYEAWGKSFLKGRRLRIVLAYQGRNLVGILPMMEERRRFMGSEITILRSMTNDQSCKYDFILKREQEGSILRSMMLHLSMRVDWDLLCLDFIPDGSKTISSLRNLEREGFCRVHVMPTMQSPYLIISGSWDAYVGKLEKSYRRNLRYFERRLEKKGRVELKRMDPESLKDALAIEESGWKGEAGTAIASSDDNTGFYGELARLTSQSGWFKLYFLCLDGDPIAFDYCLAYKDRFNVLKTGYNPAYAADSPGKVLRKKVLAQLFKDRYSIYDLLGAREEWKTKWTPHAQEIYRVLVFNKRKILPLLVYHAIQARDALTDKVRRSPSLYMMAKRLCNLFGAGDRVHEK